MPYLTSLRGLAALLVVLYHIRHHLFYYVDDFLYQVISSGYLAVDFFFVLSGFILAYTYGSKFSIVSIPRYKEFIVKRIARIYPLHIFVLLCFTIIPIAHLATGRPVNLDHYGLDSLVAKILLIDAWWIRKEYTWNVPSWSISTEFIAYVFFPLIVFLANKTPSRIKIILALIILSICAFIFEYVQLSNLNNIGRFGLYRCMLEFTLGVIAYFVVFEMKVVQNDRAKILLIVTVIGFVVLSLSNVANYYYAPVMFAFIIIALTGYSGFPHRILENKCLVYLGEISYSIYMTHYFIREFFAMIFLENEEVASLFWIFAYIAATILFSLFTYNYIEVPARKRMTNRLLSAQK